MESFADILAGMGQNEGDENTIPCRYCGARVQVAEPEKQFTLRCPSCGNEIRLSQKYRLFRKFIRPDEEEEVCPYCWNTGIVEVQRQIDEQVYTFGYRCICQAGRNHPGTAIPLAVGVDLAPVARRNRAVMERRLMAKAQKAKGA